MEEQNSLVVNRAWRQGNHDREESTLEVRKKGGWKKKKRATIDRVFTIFQRYEPVLKTRDRAKSQTMRGGIQQNARGIKRFSYKSGFVGGRALTQK